MSILERSALEESPLADLHAIASELSIDGYRRLRRAELIDEILERQGEAPTTAAGGEAPSEKAADESPAENTGDDALEGAAADAVPASTATAGGEGTPSDERQDRPAPRRRRRPEDEPIIEGVVELLPNGSGFVRVHPPEPSDDDVYVSAAQVKRCELVSGDRISGPRRAPRRSERFASLVRVDQINGRPAAEVADAARFEDLPAAFPSDRFRLGSEDPTVKAIEWLAPIGRGSRVTIVGPPRAGKTEALRRLATALSAHEDLQLLLVLAGIRPEEVPEWSLEPAAVVGLGASSEVQAQAVERVVDQARRLAARGSHAVLLVDSLEALPRLSSRRALAAARSVVDGGSLTVLATAPEPVGGETTVIALDPVLSSTARFPALDLGASWTIRPELLVGEAGAAAIARTRAEALEG